MCYDEPAVVWRGRSRSNWLGTVHVDLTGTCNLIFSAISQNGTQFVFSHTLSQEGAPARSPLRCSPLAASPRSAPISFFLEPPRAKQRPAIARSYAPPATTVRSKYNKRAKQGEQRRQDDGSRVWLIESSARRCHRQGHLGPNAGTGGGRPGGDEVL